MAGGVLFLESGADRDSGVSGPSRVGRGGGRGLIQQCSAQVRVTLQRRGVRRLQVAVDVAHHARRLLVALSVDVPEHQQRPAPGELQREEAAQAAAGARDQAHLARHTLLLGPHQPARRGQHERPEHFKSDHEELHHDVHRDARGHARAQRPRPRPTRAGQSGSPPWDACQSRRDQKAAPRARPRGARLAGVRGAAPCVSGATPARLGAVALGCARGGGRPARRLLPAATHPSRSARLAGRSCCSGGDSRELGGARFPHGQAAAARASPEPARRLRLTPGEGRAAETARARRPPRELST